MNIDTCIDRTAQKIRASQLTDNNKTRALRLLESIRAAPQAIRRFVKGLLAGIREHRKAIEILTFALALAILAKAVPVLGDVLAFLVILLGAGVAFLVEVRRSLSRLFTVDMEVTQPI